LWQGCRLLSKSSLLFLKKRLVFSKSSLVFLKSSRLLNTPRTYWNQRHFQGMNSGVDGRNIELLNTYYSNLSCKLSHTPKKKQSWVLRETQLCFCCVMAVHVKTLFSGVQRVVVDACFGHCFSAFHAGAAASAVHFTAFVARPCLAVVNAQRLAACCYLAFCHVGKWT